VERHVRVAAEKREKGAGDESGGFGSKGGGWQ
jgi:hypothetical protein